MRRSGTGDKMFMCMWLFIVNDHLSYIGRAN